MKEFAICLKHSLNFANAGDVILGDEVYMWWRTFVGFILNNHKCEIFGLFVAATSIWLSWVLEFNMFILRSSPLLSDASEEQYVVQNVHLSKCRLRLKLTTAHEGLCLLKSYLEFILSIVFLFRTT